MRITCLVLLSLSSASEHVWDEDDYYTLLGVSSEADASEIKKNYRKMSLKFHPDKAGGDPEMFRKVALAYEVLSDPIKRNAYDRDGQEGVDQEMKNQQERAQGMFGNFFGGKKPNVPIPLMVTLESIYTGQGLVFSVFKQCKCRKCRGSGAHTEKDVKPCTKCGGKGMIVKMHEVFPGMYQQMQTHCPHCSGKGKIVSKICQFCKGSKIAETKTDLKVFIERGTPEGHTLQFNHAADETPDEAANDIIFHVQALPHKVFTRSGDNLLAEITITLKEALTGFKRSLVHLDGKEIIISAEVGEVIAPLSKRVMRGQGMPIFGDFGSGDLILTFQVVFPTSLESDQVSRLREIEL
jgi:DnaJ-related protein SCJ1